MQAVKLYFIGALCALLLLAFTGCTAGADTSGDTGSTDNSTHSTSEPTAEDGNIADDLFS